MSKVTARLVNSMQPAPTTRPREIVIHDVAFRVNNGVLEEAWADNRSKWWPKTNTYSIARIENGHLILGTDNKYVRAGAAQLVDLVNNPTETVPAPTPEPTVVLEMPKDVAQALGNLAGSVQGGGPVRVQTDQVYNAILDLLGPVTYQQQLFKSSAVIR